MGATEGWRQIFPTTRRTSFRRAAAEDLAVQHAEQENLGKRTCERVEVARSVYGELSGRYRRAAVIVAKSMLRDQGAAEDAAHDFLVHCFRRRIFGRWDPKKGRFRNFFETALKNFILNQIKAREKDPLGKGAAALDDEPRDVCDDGDMGVRLAGTDFVRAWTADLLREADARMRAELAGAGIPRTSYELYYAMELAPVLDQAGKPVQKEKCAELGISEKNASRTIENCRKRFMEMVRAVLKESGFPDGEVGHEIDDVVLFLNGACPRDN